MNYVYVIPFGTIIPIIKLLYKLNPYQQYFLNDIMKFYILKHVIQINAHKAHVHSL